MSTKKHTRKPPHLSYAVLMSHLNDGVLPLHVRQGWLQREYRRRKKLWWDNPRNRKCARCTKPASQIHHTHGRLKWLLIYEPWWASLCHPCHDYCHSQKAYAFRGGLICGFGEWNAQPPKEKLIPFLKQTLICRSTKK